MGYGRDGGESTRNDYTYAGEVLRSASYSSASAVVDVEQYEYDADGNRSPIRTLGSDGAFKTCVSVNYATASQIDAQR